MKRMPRRIFTEEFKKEAVRLFKEQDLTLAEIGRNLDIDPKLLKSWLKLCDSGELKGSLGVTKLTPDQLRTRELECELAIAREERDILKIATAYFHSEQCALAHIFCGEDPCGLAKISK